MSGQTLRHTLLTLSLAAAGACAASAPYQGVPGDELLAMAEEKIADEEWGDAADILQRLTVTYPDFPQMADAQYMLAEAYFNDEKFITARQQFATFISRHPGDPRVPAAALGACRSLVEQSAIPQRDQTETRQAARVCGDVVRDFTGIDDEVARIAADFVNEMRSKLGQKMFANAEFYAARDRVDSAVLVYERVVEEFGDTVWAPRAMVGIIEMYREIGYDDLVEAWRERLLSSYPDSPEARALGGLGPR